MTKKPAKRRRGVKARFYKPGPRQAFIDWNLHTVQDLGETVAKAIDKIAKKALEEAFELAMTYEVWAFLHDDEPNKITFELPLEYEDSGPSWTLDLSKLIANEINVLLGKDELDDPFGDDPAKRKLLLKVWRDTFLSYVNQLDAALVDG